MTSRCWTRRPSVSGRRWPESSSRSLRDPGSPEGSYHGDHRVPAAQDEENLARGERGTFHKSRVSRSEPDRESSCLAESLHRLGVPASESPTQQWERIRAVTVEAAYTIIQLLDTLRIP